MSTSFSYMPQSIYGDFPYDAIKKDLVNTFGPSDYDDKTIMYIKEHATEDVGLTFNDAGFLTIISSSEDHSVTVAMKVENMIRKHLPSFRYKYGAYETVILTKRIYTLLDKHNKLKGTVDEPLFSDRRFVEELLKIMD